MSEKSGFKAAPESVLGMIDAQPPGPESHEANGTHCVPFDSCEPDSTGDTGDALYRSEKRIKRWRNSSVEVLEQEFKRRAGTIVQKMAAAGEILIAAKGKLPHGQWLPFIERCGINRRTAARLMELARVLPTLLQDRAWTQSTALAFGKPARISNGSLDDDDDDYVETADEIADRLFDEVAGSPAAQKRLIKLLYEAQPMPEPKDKAPVPLEVEGARLARVIGRALHGRDPAEVEVVVAAMVAALADEWGTVATIAVEHETPDDGPAVEPAAFDNTLPW